MATPRKTAPKTLGGRPFAKGEDARRGGGKKGRSGRKPVYFIQACSDLTDDLVLPKVQAYLAQAKADPSDAAWRWCADYVTNYGKGKPTQPVSGEGGGPVTVRVEYVDEPTVSDDSDD
jgi:hypothetical protein